MIYTRFGSPVRFTRLGTAADCVLDGRKKPDNHDRKRAARGCYMVGDLLDDKEATTKERLFDVGMLRADGGWKEIEDAAIAAGNTLINKLA
jgi:hypothetical protein